MDLNLPKKSKNKNYYEKIANLLSDPMPIEENLWKNAELLIKKSSKKIRKIDNKTTSNRDQIKSITKPPIKKDLIIKDLQEKLKLANAKNENLQQQLQDTQIAQVDYFFNENLCNLDQSIEKIIENKISFQN